jgi:hypothetical protein
MNVSKVKGCIVTSGLTTHSTRRLDSIPFIIDLSFPRRMLRSARVNSGVRSLLVTIVNEC